MDSETTAAHWHNKPFISFLTLTGFITMSLTGVVLFFVPQGKIAFWVNWTFWGMTKEDWGNIHITTSLFFLIAGAYHTYYNWKPLMSYMVNKMTGAMKLKKEMAVATLITVFIVAGGLFKIVPFNYVLHWNEFLKKEFWVSSRKYMPPFGHAEEVSLKSFAKKMDMDLEQAVSIMKENGLRFIEKDTLLKIAQNNNTTPMAIYKMIKKLEPEKKRSGKGELSHDSLENKFGKGLGRVTLQEVCEQFDMDLRRTIHMLEYESIVATGETTMREIGQKLETNPMGAIKAVVDTKDKHRH